MPLMSFASEFIGEALCDTVGTVGEYLRLNDVVRDYVARGSISIPEKYAASIRTFSKSVFESDVLDEHDYSEQYAAVRVALLEGKEVPERLLIPAHFLGAIIQKYKNRKYDDVIALADRIIGGSNYEQYIRDQVRFYLCMSLARRDSNRFLPEVNKIRGVDHNYILGFYYRRRGRYKDAIERLELATKERKWEENSKRELVLIYNIMEDYDKAFSLARDSYRGNPTNPINVQAYFEVLLNVPRTADTINELLSTLEGIQRVSSEKAQEVSFCMRGKYTYWVERNVEMAFQILDEGKSLFPQSPYPVLAKLEIAVDIRSLKDIHAAIGQIRDGEHGDQQARVMITRAEIIAMALSGMKGKALARIETDLPFLFPAAKDKLRAKINAI